MTDALIISREKLLNLKNTYIYHGSHELFDVCKPQQAHCETHNKENEQFAIYGSDEIRFAILFAFYKLPRENFSWSASFINNRWTGILYDKTYIDDQDYGYIYCFNKSCFKPTCPGGNQYICMKSLKPKKIYKIFFKDFQDFFIKA